MESTTYFKTTDEAIEFGATATPDQITEMMVERVHSLHVTGVLMKKGYLNTAFFKEAFRGQLLREAIQAYQEK